MKKAIPAIALAVLATGTSVAHAQYANVIITGEISPGVYGHVQFGNAPPPPVVYAQPVVVVRDRRYVEPIYLHVPPGHARNWDQHCHRYRACYHPVYFVRSVEYEPGYRHDKGHHGKGKGWAKGHDKGRD